MEFVIEIVFELLLEGLFEGAGWVLGKRWGRLVLGVGLGAVGGLAWSLFVTDAAPLLGTFVVAGQAAAVPLLAGRDVLGRTLQRTVLLDLVLIGAAVVAGRWVGWVVA